MSLCQVVNLLHFRTHTDAASAQNAFIGIAYDGLAGHIHAILLAFPLKMPGANAHGRGQPLKFAVAVAFAGVTIHRVVVHQQFHDVTPGAAQFLRIGVNLHPIIDRIGTRCNETFGAFHLDNTDSTGTLNRQLGVIAQTRNMETQLVRRLHNRLVRLYLVFSAVNINRNQFFHSL